MAHPGDSHGRFIVFEGIDGSGTTTQIARYAAYLRGERRIVHTTREPSDGPIGTLLRLAMSGRVSVGGSLQAETLGLLFAADRLDHLKLEIEAHLRDGAVVLSDRYDLSSLAYQWASSGRADEDGEFLGWLRSLNRFARRPHATLVLDVSPEAAERRRRARQSVVELYEVASLQTKLAALYRDAERLVPGDRVIHVDGDASVEEVEARIRAALAPIVEG
jgi:dTMP kinase